MTKDQAIMYLRSMQGICSPQDRMAKEAVKMATEALSADSVQGEWDCMIADGTDGSHWYEYECSHCGEVVLRPYNFCPNCGAKMFREDGEV